MSDETTFKLIARMHALETFLRDIHLSIILQQPDPEAFLKRWYADIEKRTSAATISGHDPAISDALSAETAEAMLRHADAVMKDVRAKLNRKGG